MEQTHKIKGRRGPANRRVETPNRLRPLRLAAGLSLLQLAEMIGCHYQALYRAEMTGKGLSRSYWYRLADVYKCDPRDLEKPAQITASP